MNSDPRGTIVSQGSIMRVTNALVEEAFCSDNSSGYIIISYSVPEENNAVSIQNLRLNLDRNTVILNSLGQSMCLCCIQAGMWVNALVSARMTRSIPPQSYAFFIMVDRRQQSEPSVTTNRIASIDTDNSFLYTGNPNDIYSQTRFVVPNTTTITDRRGRLIDMNALRPGQLVKITHANFQTASIPPQTTAFHIQLL